MMNKDKIINKTRTIQFSKGPTEDFRKDLDNLLQNLDGISKIEFNANRILLEYQFPIITFESVINIISENKLAPEFGQYEKIKQAIIMFMEKNQRDYLTHNIGWHRYTEDIYIHNFHSRFEEGSGIYSQHWRKH